MVTFASTLQRHFILKKKQVDPAKALAEIMAWLARAQDATADDGVAQAYFIHKKSWTASYPETTGYIILTFFDYAQISKNQEFFARAIRMADWEVRIQLPGGGIQASTIDAPKVIPTIFNTGMVVFGWARAYVETKNKKYLEAMIKAADWLVTVQDEDGAWRKFGSTQTTQALNTYNTRVAWALLEADQIAEKPSYRHAARKNLDWALMQQLPNGWLQNNCLLDNRQPYTHTLAYAMRGFLEAYAHLRDERYLEAANRLFNGVRPSIKSDGFLPGRFDQNWRPTVSYCCLTGNSQLALNAFRMFELAGETYFRDEAKKLLSFVLSTIDVETADPHKRGGIAGSYPINGKYHPDQYPNWAAKFTADAIIKCSADFQSATIKG